ncbi:MAG: Uncharacterized protein G01um101449_61 [Parcubacteria group bacterium Gr01-1014_49]|nr:MAG: Uncharacterized protein G01um101449_61 [Parcubacteria group bacterium Gr01-1014_49]
MDRRVKHIDTKWSEQLSYVVGLITSDGNLSSDGRHINITSKDLEIVQHVKDILRLSNKIGKKARGGSHEKKYYVLQFGSKNFYAFLLSLGLTPAKSKTIQKVSIPDTMFSDFLRGCFDGDGNISESRHPESSHSQLRLSLASASKPFLVWMLKNVRRMCGIRGGWITKLDKKSTCLLRFGKRDSIQIFRAMYAHSRKYTLQRKLAIAEKYLGE